MGIGAGDCELVATGYQFTEGPVWSGHERHLLFSDVSGDVITRWSPDAGASDWRRPSGNSNGLVYDADQRLVACEHARNAVTRSEPDGTVAILASHVDGKELNSPNDVAIAPDGSIWFTDPHPSGRVEPWGPSRPRELDFQGVFRIAPDGGEPTCVADDFEFPNGLCFSPDSSRLYVNDSSPMHVRVFDVGPGGSLRGGSVFLEEPGAMVFENGIPDGMKCDERGSLYCTGPGGIWVTSPAGEHVGTIETPEPASNMCFGGPSWTTLFVTATHSVYRVELGVRSAPLPHMR